nr:hypothetical protein [uncultured Actinoplanes sp.]
MTLLCEVLASDPGMNDAVSRRFPDARRLTEVCDAQMNIVRILIDRAHRAGALRTDFTTEDFPFLLWSTATIVRATASTAPEAWRRALTFALDGLRAGPGTTESDVPPLTEEQMHTAMVGLGERRRARG